MTAVYTSEDGTVYHSTDGWRVESYGTDKVLAREVGGTLDAEIANGESRTDILIASRDAIARLVRRDAKRRPRAVRREREGVGPMTRRPLYQIAVDGQPRSNRDDKAIAIDMPKSRCTIW
jgi:hypothetical protein